MNTLRCRQHHWAMLIAIALALILLFAAATVAHGAKPAATEFTEVLGMKPNLEAGAKHFETCSACHGLAGAGLIDGTVPRLAGQHYRVLVKQLVDFRHSRRWDVRMELFSDNHHLPEAQDVADVAAYAAQLQPTGASGVGAGDQVKLGADVYRERCQVCHGAKAEGSDGRLVPRLAGQQYAYLVRQLHDTADGRRPPMSAQHQRLTRKLEAAETDSVADYLSRLSDSESGSKIAAP